MRFSTVAITAFCGLAAAREMTLKERQITVLQPIVEKVQAQVQALDKAILAFSGDAKPVVDASEALIASTKEGTAAASAASQITDNDSLTLQKIVTNLLKDVQKAVDDIIAKKSVAAANNLGGVTLGQLDAQLAGAQQLSQALISKVPAKLQPVGKSLSDNIIAAVQKGVDAYSEFKSSEVPAAGAAAGAAAGGAAAGAAAGGATTSSSAGAARVSNAPASTAAAGNSTAAAGAKSDAGSIRPAGVLAAVALGVVALAL